MTEPLALALSGQRFTAVYQLSCPAGEAESRARDICLEQTVEFPEDLIPHEAIRAQIVGRIASLEPIGDGLSQTLIEFPIEAAGRELPQLLNVLFGNTSIKPGIRLVRFDLPDSLAGQYRGPRFGIPGLRRLLGVTDRPLVCTAIKPMGLSPAELADLTYRLALGGIDLIKDDHGLADQDFCPFADRVRLCAAAVRRANQQTGLNCLYLPNLTAPWDEVGPRARLACEAGAGGFLFSPGLGGWDAMRAVADDDAIGLPIFSHPAFLGAFTSQAAAGIAHGALYGQISRLAGADATIFPNYGGRFSFTTDECRDIVAGCTRAMGSLRPIFPVPAGGMSLGRVPELCEFYGLDAVLLVGGDLHRHGPDLAENCRKFIELVRRAGPASR
jgi:ribulose-bisphosphate carboxylase large chain